MTFGTELWAKEVIHLTAPSEVDNPVVVAGVKMLREAYSQIGYEVEISFETIGRAMISSNQGRADGELARVASLRHEFPNLVQTRPSIVQVEFIALSLKKDLKIAGWKSLQNYRLAAETGFKHVEYNTKGMNITFVPNREQLFQMLFHDRVDFVLMERTKALKVLEKMSEQKIKHPEVYEAGLLDKVPLYHFLNKSRADLVPKINQVLASMHAKGQLEKIWNDELAAIHFDLKKAK